MVHEHLYDTIFSLITDFAWQIPMTYDQLYSQLITCEEIQECIPIDLLNLVVYDKEKGTNVVNPFRNFNPFRPIHNLDIKTIWSSVLYSLPTFLKFSYFNRNKTYRNVFKRHIKELFDSGFRNYNKILSKYLITIEPNDFEYNYLNFGILYNILLECEPLSPVLLNPSDYTAHPMAILH